MSHGILFLTLVAGLELKQGSVERWRGAGRDKDAGDTTR